MFDSLFILLAMIVTCLVARLEDRLFVTRFYKTDHNRTSYKIKLAALLGSYTTTLLVISIMQFARSWF